MQLYFRELTYEDIPQILDITKDMWEGEDYIPNVIDKWLKDRDNCLNYGGFKDINKTELVGFGRVKIFPNRLAWLEGGRVRVNLQRKGIGKALMKYAIDYAYKAGAKIAQYDTSSRNFGSLAIAQHLGFREKKRMEVLECKLNQVIISERFIGNIKEISLNEAKKMYKKLNIGPGNEICIGWSHIPLEFLSDENSVWIKKDKAILQKIKLKRAPIQEGPSKNEIWMITYGNELAIQDLIEISILNELTYKNIDWVVIYCKQEITKFVQKLGFSYWENEPISVVLLEKKLLKN